MKTIFDPLRRKHVAATPEEMVRQHIILWLHHEKGVSFNKMMSEFSMKFNGLNYRSDIVVFDRELKPLILVECKAPSVKIDQSVVEQGLRYNRVLKVKLMMFTNGNSTYLCRLEEENGQYVFLNEFPSYSELI